MSCFSVVLEATAFALTFAVPALQPAKMPTAESAATALRATAMIRTLMFLLLEAFIVVLVMFGLNWLWTLVLTPWFEGLFAKPVFGLGINAVLKSVLFLVLGLAALYKLKVSQSVNDLIDKAMKIIGWK